MNISVIGAAGGAGRLVAEQLAEAGHTAQAMIRRPEQADLPELQGAHIVIGDLNGYWQAALDGTEAVVWGAGAGTSGQFQLIDGDALMRVTDYFAAHGPRRLIVVPYMGVDRPDQMPPFLSAVLKIEAVSDAHVQGSGLDFTILRPGGLRAGHRASHAGAAGSRRHCPAPGRGPRGAGLHDAATIGQTVELVSGEEDIEAALSKLN